MQLEAKIMDDFFSAMVNIQGEQEDSGEKERFLMKRRRKEVGFRSHENISLI